MPPIIMQAAKGQLNPKMVLEVILERWVEVLKWYFPLRLNVLGPTLDSMSFENIDEDYQVEIPVGQHVGAFGVQRKFDVHRGVDLYCPPLDPVFAVEDGIVVDYRDWTGEEGLGTPVYQKCVADFTGVADEAVGVYTVWACLAKASTTVYVCPKVVVA